MVLMSFYNVIIAVLIKIAQVVSDTITNWGGITVTGANCRLFRVNIGLVSFIKKHKTWKILVQQLDTFLLSTPNPILIFTCLTTTSPTPTKQCTKTATLFVFAYFC